MESIAILLALVLCFGVVCVFFFVGRWIVVPIDRAAKAGQPDQPRVQFSIGDFLCLFFAIQIPLAAIHVLVRTQERNVFWTFTLATWIVGPMVWYTCGRALSRAGVTGGRRRLLFLGLVLPIVYYGLIPFAILPALAVWAKLTRDVILEANLQGLGWTWFGLGALLFGCGLYTRRLVRQVKLHPDFGEFAPDFDREERELAH